MNKFLIVKTSSLGDIIQTFPVAAYLKQKFPESQIDWVVEEPFSDLLKSHPDINQIHRVNTKQWRLGKNLKTFWEFKKHLQEKPYDFIWDFQGNFKSGIFTWLAQAKNKIGFGWETVPEWPNLLFTNHKMNPPKGNNIRLDYLYLVQKFLNDPLPFECPGVLLKITEEQKKQVQSVLSKRRPLQGPYFMVCPGSAWPNKRLSSETLVEWLEHLRHKYHCSFLFIWGTEEEFLVAEKLQHQFHNCSFVVEKLSLPVLQNVMNHMDLVISMDSLPLHLAGTTRTPTLGIFGASSAHKYQPLGANCQVYQGGCPYHQLFDKRCPRLRTCQTGACIRALKAEAFEAFQYPLSLRKEE